MTFPTRSARSALAALSPALCLTGCLPRAARQMTETTGATVALVDETGSAAIVAPGLGGRVIAFHPANAPAGAALFWANPLRDIDQVGWPNIGGEKTWIGPQEFWSEMIGGSSWPPPTYFDQGRFHVWPGAASNSMTMLSPAPTGFACPFVVERAISLRGGTLSIEASLRPAPGADTTRPIDDYIAWSVAQVPHSEHIAVRTLPPARLRNTLPEPSDAGDGILLFDLTDFTNRGKAFFDADAIAVELAGGALVARRVPSSDDPDPESVPFPEHARAELFSGWAGNHSDVRYLELEFTATGTRPLLVEFSFRPGVSCVEALRTKP